MGFNNLGAAALADRLAAAGVARGNQAAGIPIGISIGKTKITPLAEAAEDYLTSLRRARAVRRLRRDQRLQPEHPRPAFAAGRGRARELLRRPGRRGLAHSPPGAARCRSSSSWPPISTDERAGGGCSTSAPTPAPRASSPPTPPWRATAWLAADQPRAAEAGGLSGAPLTARAREVVAFLRRADHAADHRGRRHHQPPTTARRCSTPAPACCRSTPASSSTDRRSSPISTGRTTPTERVRRPR